VVAASYAGSVCVDFPLCNGQWAPTFQGAIGLQVLHRFGAYAVVLGAWALAAATLAFRGRSWSTPQIARSAELLAIVAFAQACVGVANLLLYIPPLMTVLHQTGAMVTLVVSYRLAFVSWRASDAGAEVAVAVTEAPGSATSASPALSPNFWRRIGLRFGPGAAERL
jgi:heme A synthase